MFAVETQVFPRTGLRDGAGMTTESTRQLGDDKKRDNSTMVSEKSDGDVFSIMGTQARGSKMGTSNRRLWLSSRNAFGPAHGAPLAGFERTNARASGSRKTKGRTASHA